MTPQIFNKIIFQKRLEKISPNINLEKKSRKKICKKKFRKKLSRNKNIPEKFRPKISRKNPKKSRQKNFSKKNLPPYLIHSAPPTPATKWLTKSTRPKIYQTENKISTIWCLVEYLFTLGHPLADTKNKNYSDNHFSCFKFSNFQFFNQKKANFIAQKSYTKTHKNIYI